VSGPEPAVAAVRGAVRSALDDLAEGSRVLVACSGGADSLALAAAGAFVGVRTGVGVGAVVVDHAWSAESADVAATAAAQCRALGLDPVDVVAVQARARPGDGGPEAVARAARYAALDEAARRHTAAAVLLGHTLEDQAETVLLGLLRGSGARSLAGMPARRGLYRRPLLALSRATTLAACAASGLTPWHDPANADPAYARSRLRAVLPRVRALLTDALGPSLDDALARTAAQLREDADALDAAAADLLARASASDPPGRAPGGLALDVLAGASDAVRRRALLAAFREAGSPAGALGRRHVLAVDALVVAWRGQGPVHLPGRVEARRACGRLWLISTAELPAGQELSSPLRARE
jgi:tRNA(Ile)-lysidine synthase